MRIAVVAALHDSEWSEENLIVWRLAGALACGAEVEVLVADGGASGTERRGAVEVRRFAATPVSAEVRAAYLRAAFGFFDAHHPALCCCAGALGREIARALPSTLQRRIAELAAPASRDLRDHLNVTPYDVVVAAGYAAWTRLDGVRGPRRVLAPLARDEPSFHLPVFDGAFADADAIVVFGDAEERLVRSRIEPGNPVSLENVGFVLRVDSTADATADDEKHRFVIARDWHEPFALGWLAGLARRLTRRFGNAELRLVGPGVSALPELPGVVTAIVRSRRDVEALMGRATAVLDPEPHRLLGREVVEATMLCTPVIVHACGGATREHAEAGDGGLWYRSDAELDRCLDLLTDRTLRATLGAQGRAYAERRYGDPDAFIRRVTEAVTG